MQKNTETDFINKNLGNISVARENLGPDMPVAVYRLFQYSLREVLETSYGKEHAASLIRDAGKLAGLYFAENALDLTGNFDYFVANLINKLKELKIGILRIESADMNNLSFVMTVAEDLDCSGLPVSGETVCNYDEGFIAGILERYTGRSFAVKEIDCWSTGDRTCRFAAILNDLTE